MQRGQQLRIIAINRRKKPRDKNTRGPELEHHAKPPLNPATPASKRATQEVALLGSWKLREGEGRESRLSIAVKLRVTEKNFGRGKLLLPDHV